LVSSAALVGAICGQLVFGFLADRIGRKKGKKEKERSRDR
jgi:MFS family permease